MADTGLRELAPLFFQHLVNGQLLIDISMEELQHPAAIACSSPLVCKWFLQQVRTLRCKADLSAEDPDNICQWLTAVGPELAVYKPDFVRNRVTKELLPQLTDEVLVDIGVRRPVDRLKLSIALDRLDLSAGKDFPDYIHSITPASRKKYDVFLSYRRSTGSQLASLLKVHLQLKGLNVFLDVTGLGGGKFDDALLTTISNSLNMIMVLTPGALDRCQDDDRVQDWVHKELVHALDNSIPVVPVLDNFMWPESDLMPADIRAIRKLNGVHWTHEYQDACVDKLVSFLNLPTIFKRKGTGLTKPRAGSATLIRTDSLSLIPVQ